MKKVIFEVEITKGEDEAEIIEEFRKQVELKINEIAHSEFVQGKVDLLYDSTIVETEEN